MNNSGVLKDVQDRYRKGAEERQDALCCPVDYDQSLLQLLPKEIIDKDYGCGDPSRYVRPGDHVLDLGSGGGKICYMAAQLVGEHGHVTGVDITDEMLVLARKYQAEMAVKLGGDRVTFLKGYIQDLALDINATETLLTSAPVKNSADLQMLLSRQETQRREAPLVASGSINLVISNCVLNLVAESDRKQMIKEIYRVLGAGGRVAISDIVADESVPDVLKNDRELWSGCISGAFQETEFLKAFVDAGFVAVGYDKWDSKPWRMVDGIEFRSVTLTAMKPIQNNNYDGGHAVLYRGPYSEVQDDQRNVYYRGQRMAVSKNTYDLLTGKNSASTAPYGGDFIGFSPAEPLNKGPYDLSKNARRPACETKSGEQASNSESGCC